MTLVFSSIFKLKNTRSKRQVTSHHEDGYEDFCTLGYAMSFGDFVPTFRKTNFLAENPVAFSA
jgi:hypothetical protein